VVTGTRRPESEMRQALAQMLIRLAREEMRKRAQSGPTSAPGDDTGPDQRTA